MGLTSVLLDCKIFAKDVKEAFDLINDNEIVCIKDIPLKKLMKPVERGIYSQEIDADIIGNFRNLEGYKPSFIQTTKGLLRDVNFFVCCNYNTYQQFGSIIDNYYTVDAYYFNGEFLEKLTNKNYTIV